MSIRESYHRPADHPVPVAHRVIAKDLRVGDVITKPGFIPLTVEAVRVHTAHHMVSIDYSCFNGTGADHRAYAITELLDIAPRKPLEAH